MPFWIEEQLKRLFPNEEFVGGGYSVPRKGSFSAEDQNKVASLNPHIMLEDYTNPDTMEGEAVIDTKKQSYISKLYSTIFSRFHPLPNKFYFNLNDLQVRDFVPSEINDVNSIYQPREDSYRLNDHKPNDYQEVLINLARRSHQEQVMTRGRLIMGQKMPSYQKYRSFIQSFNDTERYTPKLFLHYQYLREKLYLTELYKNLAVLSDVETKEPTKLGQCDQLLLDLYTVQPVKRLEVANSLQECIAKTHCKEAYSKYVNAVGDDKDFAVDSLYDCVSEFPEYFYVRDVQKTCGNL